MADKSGGPAYPCRETFVTLNDDGELEAPEEYRWCPGMSARLWIATKLAAAMVDVNNNYLMVNDVTRAFDGADMLIAEEERRVIEDAKPDAELQAGAEALANAYDDGS